MYQREIKKWGDIASKYRGETLILGNGASIAISGRFAYRSLKERAQQAGFFSNAVTELFYSFQSDDFELILRNLRTAAAVNSTLSIPDREIVNAYHDVKLALIQAVRDVHPSYNQVISQLPAARHFLSNFKTVLSLNYDLLVYWAMTHNFSSYDAHVFKDCFFHGHFHSDWRRYRNTYSAYERTNTLVFYPHGNLALSTNGNAKENKIHADGDGLLEQILWSWKEDSCVPLFISEGTSEQKERAIQRSDYLSTIYHDVLPAPRFSLTLYGWGMGDQDMHLLNQLSRPHLGQIAVSVFRNDQKFCNRAGLLLSERWPGIHVDFFDSESVGCWIHT